MAWWRLDVELLGSHRMQAALMDSTWALGVYCWLMSEVERRHNKRVALSLPIMKGMAAQLHGTVDQARGGLTALAENFPDEGEKEGVAVVWDQAAGAVEMLYSDPLQSEYWQGAELKAGRRERRKAGRKPKGPGGAGKAKEAGAEGAKMESRENADNIGILTDENAQKRKQCREIPDMPVRSDVRPMTYDLRPETVDVLDLDLAGAPVGATPDAAGQDAGGPLDGGRSTGDPDGGTLDGDGMTTDSAPVGADTAPASPTPDEEPLTGDDGPIHVEPEQHEQQKEQKQQEKQEKDGGEEREDKDERPANPVNIGIKSGYSPIKPGFGMTLGIGCGTEWPGEWEAAVRGYFAALPASRVAGWKDAFGWIDVEAELAECREWVVANQVGCREFAAGKGLARYKAGGWGACLEGLVYFWLRDESLKAAEERRARARALGLAEGGVIGTPAARPEGAAHPVGARVVGLWDGEQGAGGVVESAAAIPAAARARRGEWKTAAGALERIDAEGYHAWLAGLKCEGIGMDEGGTASLWLTAPSAFHRQWVLNNYSETLMRLTGAEAVRVRVEEEAEAHTKTARQEARRHEGIEVGGNVQ